MKNSEKPSRNYEIINYLSVQMSIKEMKRECNLFVDVTKIFANRVEEVADLDVVIPQPIVGNYGARLSDVSTLNTIVHWSEGLHVH